MTDSSAQTRRRFLQVFAVGIWPWQWFRPRTIGMGGGKFRIVRNGSDKRHYFWVHGNERTAREVLLDHMKTSPGRAFLVENDERYLMVNGGRLDPNRMFSREGAERNLKSLNTSWSPEQFNRVLDRLDRERPKFLSSVLPKDGKLLIAMHNNSQGYSVKDEVAISDQVSLRNEANPHEFMLCTSSSDYEKLSQSPFNVVLQKTAPKTDDGSLSRLTAARGLRYVNIEAGLGRAAEQKAMLDWVEQNLP
ncbi:MAG TPA: hypothetical protein VE621_11770 [Bryobacteraceae bacterium]|nr:hypothetical protein [Bryobacteraceae bacterium]